MSISHRSRVITAAMAVVLAVGASTSGAATPSFEDPSASPLQRQADLLLRSSGQVSTTLVSLDMPWEPGDTVAATAKAPESEAVIEEAVVPGTSAEMATSRSLDVGRCGAGDSWPNQVSSMITDLFGVMNIGGYRPGDPGDHGSGLALDVMVPGNPGLGDAVAQWAVANMGSLNVSYVIWQQRINMGGGWSGMEDRGSITANHYDHVHISLNPGAGTCN